MEDIFTQQVAEEFKKRRKQRGLTQQEIAEANGVGLNFIKSIESGKNNMQLNKLLPVLGFLGIKLKIEL